MKEFYNIILIIITLFIVYYCIQSNKNNDFFSVLTPNPVLTSNPVNKNIENSPSPKIVNNDTKYINFDYDLRPIDKEYLKEQETGTFLNTWYPNTWIDHIDENGNPVYNSRENITGNSNDFLTKPKTSSSYEFNKNKTNNMSGVLSPTDSQGKTIKEVYDNSMVNYKNLCPKKNIISDENSDIVMPGGSNLEYFTSDTWTYENENPENGGLLYNNLYADDPMSNTVAVF